MKVNVTEGTEVEATSNAQILVVLGELLKQNRGTLLLAIGHPNFCAQYSKSHR